ncbi:zf-CCHC domain-containing protein [Cephalotus follicularis]|uniref:Zf-CCHC domain-containing protein n=1 Tax=Cephalotus follicularis TaxID=3775 RepID=A0A1Q3CWK2_CEPFO|nr:zf-CCHC domain-containing protein [Cephalotus follicularis]
MAERRVLRYGARKPLSGRFDGASQRTLGSTRSPQSEQPAQRNNRETTLINRPGGGGISNAYRSEKGKEVARYGAQNSYGPGDSNANSGAQVRCYSCGDKGHVSYSCPQRRVNMAELEKGEEEMPEPTYEIYNDEEEDVDIYPVQGESLVVRRVLTTGDDEGEEDWRRRNIFRTRFLCGGKVCNVIFDGGSVENIVARDVVEKLKLPIEKHPHPYKISWFRKGNEVPVTSRCLVKFTMGDNLEDCVTLCPWMLVMFY